MLGIIFKRFPVLLNQINGWEVELVGGLLYLASVGLWFRDRTGIILLALLGLYVLASLTKVFAFLDDGHLGFADMHNWPSFVALGIACMIIAGHPHGRWIIGAVLTIYDGRYFEQNY